jgi:ribosomal protein L32
MVHMAKRSTGIEKNKTSRSKKTKKRLEIKREMLTKKASKKLG